MTAPSPPSSAVGGCCEASKWQQPNGNTFGSKPHHSAGWRSLRCPVTKPTPSGCVSPGPIHACVQMASHTYAPTTPSSSTSSGLRHSVALWAPRNPSSFRDLTVAPSPTIQVFRTAIEATGAQLTRPGPQGQPLQRFNEHVCRVSGAQFLTRLGYPMKTVQLIGRWGSGAVKRYVQDTPLSCATGSSSARTTVNRAPTQKAAQGMVKKYLEAISGKCWIKNTSTNVVRISGAPQFSTENIHWRTLCGWRYGSSPHTPFWTMPDGKKCQRCFKLQETQAITDRVSVEIHSRFLCCQVEVGICCHHGGM